MLADRRAILAGLAGLPFAAVALPSSAAASADPLVTMHRQAAACLAHLKAGADDGTDGEATWAVLSTLRESAFDMQATDLPGALASLEWARMEFAHYYIDFRYDDDPPDWLDRFTLNLLDNAIGVLRQAVGGGSHG